MSRATAITITPPSPASGDVDVASQPITVQPNGDLVSATASTPGTGTGATFSGLASGTGYIVKRKATDSAGLVRWSNTLVATTVLTPAQFLAGINALSSTGGNGGATLNGLLVKGVNQTLVAVTVGTNYAAGESPTGWRCTAWDPIGRTGVGFVPDPAIDSGAGAVCDADGTIRGHGLYIPATSPLLTELLAATPDPTVPDGGGDVALGYPNTLLQGRGHGLSIGGVMQLCNQTYAYSWGTPEATNTIQLTGDITQSASILADPVNGHYPNSLNINAGGSLPMVVDQWFCQTQFTTALTNGVTARTRLSDGIPYDNGRTVAPAITNMAATGRPFYLLRANSYTPTGQYTSNRTHLLYFGLGRLNAAQTAFLNDWLPTWSGCPGTLWRHGGILGILAENSFLYPFRGVALLDGTLTHQDRIVRGADGASRIANFGIVNWSRSGGSIPVPLGPDIRLWEDLDYRQYTRVVVELHDRINNSTEAQNISAAVDVQALWGSKAHVLWTDLIANTPSGMTARAAEFAQQLTDAAANNVVVAQLIGTAPYRTAAFAATDPLYWTNDNHPDNGGVTRALWEQPLRLAYMVGCGISVSGITCTIPPNVESVALNASASETYTPTWTPKDRAGTTLTGKTLVFSSLDDTIATVDASTGVISGIDAGDTVIFAVCEGARDALIVRVTGSAPGGGTPVTPAFQIRFSDAANLAQNSDNTGTVTNTSPIGYAADLSGNANHAIQVLGGGYRPTWNSAAYNSHGVLTTDDANQFLVLPDAAAPTSAFRLRAVVEFNLDSSVQSIFSRARSGGADNLHLHVTQFNTLKASWVIGGTGNAIASDISGLGLTGLHLVELIYDGTTVELFLDGASLGTRSASGTITYSTAGEKATIAACYSTQGGFGYDTVWHGRIAEVTCWFGTAASGVVTAERTTIQTYWGL